MYMRKGYLSFRDSYKYWKALYKFLNVKLVTTGHC